MIKFFRKIRQDLLSEGKTGKYLKYALGEIVLVMIGILLALQINNWNEQRKNSALLKNYKENLIEDLKKDSISIQKNISDIKEDKKQLDQIKVRISNSNAVLDTVLKIARFEYRFYISAKGNYNDNTYSVLNSTGDITLFKNEIIDKLNELKNLQELALVRTNNTFENYRYNLHQYAQKYPVPFEYNLFDNENTNANEIWNDISLRNHATEFNALVIAKGDTYRLSIRSLSEVFDKTIELLTEIRKHN